MAVPLDTYLPSKPRAVGLRKFNNELLKNHDFTDTIREEIHLVNSACALRIYNPEYVAMHEGQAPEPLNPVTLFLEVMPNWSTNPQIM